jgi:hypothetical protein
MAPCGRSSLSMRVKALRLRKRPLNASMKALSVGFPGREKFRVTPLA